MGKQAQGETTTGVSLKEPQGIQDPPLCSSAPSPAPTEIIPLDLTQEEIVEEIQKTYAILHTRTYQCTAPSSSLIPYRDGSHMKPYLHTRHVMRIAFPGKITRRLLDIGWIDRTEEEGRWSVKDREALEAYDKRSHYPWHSLKVPKPDLDSLTQAWRTRYQELTANEPPPPVSRPFSRFRAFKFGGMEHKKRGVTDEQEVQNGDISPQTKKRRLAALAV